ncbi:unnamed protein product [Euphydryas editha]|uniref:Uncharacterized protein n=1 Tax=Euphydryas editha TaxID=104508 RepID=A0AAU9UUW9_EUPED|nr:unnamed protein product [Euphydryas editha]
MAKYRTLELHVVKWTPPAVTKIPTSSPKLKREMHRIIEIVCGALVTAVVRRRRRVRAVRCVDSERGSARAAVAGDCPPHAPYPATPLHLPPPPRRLRYITI